MKIRYNQIENDLSKVLKESLGSQKLFKVIGYIFVISIGISVISEFSINGFSIDAILSYLMPLAVLGLFWIGIRKWSIRQVKNPSDRGMEFIGEKEIEITEDKLILNGSNYTTSFEWTALTEFKEDQEFYVIKSGRAVVACIRKSSISNSALENEFFEQVRFRI